MKHNAADGLFTKPSRKEGMMREVAVVGAGITTCKGRWVERTYYGLSQMAVKAALEDACISVKDADAVVYGIYNDIFELSAIPEHPLQGIIGMANKPGLRVTTGGLPVPTPCLQATPSSRAGCTMW